MIKYSIITATYKQKQYLPKLIEALENQTVKDFELCICLDGDVDGTEDYLKSLETSFPLRIFKQKNKGFARLARVVNLGIKAAQGQYCVFIMGDSFPELNYLEVLDQHVGPEKIINGIRIQIDGGKGVDMDYRIKKSLIPKANVLLVKQPFNIICGNGLTIPTALMHEYGGWDENIEGYGGEDNEVVARFYYKGYTIWSIVDARIYHHWHMSSDSVNSNYVVSKINEYAR